MRRGSLAVAALGLVALGGCASAWVAAADEEGKWIADEKMAVVEGFRSDLVRPADVDGEREKVAAPIEVPEVLQLEDAVRIATTYNRDYLTQQESFFLTALSLGLTRRDFTKPVFSGDVSFSGTKLSGENFTDSTRIALAGTQFLPTGGRLTVSGSASANNASVNDFNEYDAQADVSVSLSQPLLRGAGKSVAFEPLTQAERSAVYAARDFELFRQRFAIEIVRDYYGLVSQKIGLANTQRNVENQQFALDQAQALYDLQMGPQIDVLRAQQQLTNARNDALDAEQAYRLALDRFKIRLGLPVDAEFDVGNELPSEVVPIDVDLEGALQAALLNRLDLLTQRERLEDAERQVAIAKNNLLPDLDLTVTGSTGSITNSFLDLDFRGEALGLGLNLEIPLDRKAERNAYRAALIDLDQSRRALRLAEDNTIVEVRDLLRRLRQQESQIENDRANIRILERTVRRADLDQRAGTGSNRDLVEALNDLTQAQNGLLDRYVTYLTTKLNTLQSLGLLFVDKEGRVIEP